MLQHQRETLLDFSLETEEKITLLTEILKESESEVLEIIHTLARMYELTSLSSVREYIISLISSNIPPMFKIILIEALISTGDGQKTEAFALLRETYKTVTSSVPYKLELIKLMLTEKNDVANENAFIFLQEILEKENVSSVYKYEKVILVFEKESFINRLMLLFMKGKNDNRYVILSAQFLLKSGNEDAVKYLLNIAENKDNDDNCRADACDVLLTFKKEEERARQIILNLGKSENKNPTLYQNTQNVHNDSIEASVKEGISFLIEMDNEYSKIPDPTLEEIEKEMLLITFPEHKDLITSSISRIRLDRAAYAFNLSLKQIAIKVWKFICSHENKDELKNRMKQELIDIAGTCASGYQARLINVISGYTNFNLRISWRDQISANIAGRLNARARVIDNLNFQEKVLNEMANMFEEKKQTEKEIEDERPEDNRHSSKKNFMKFFQDALPEIVLEMQLEFSPYITDTDFELYLRYALMKYEGN